MGAFETCLESKDSTRLESPAVINPVDQFRSIVPHTARRSHYFELNGMSLLAVATDDSSERSLTHADSGPPISETIVYQINNDASLTGIDTTQALSPVVWQVFRKARKTAPIPSNMPGSGNKITKSESHGCINTFTIEKDGRLRHFLIIGLLETYGYKDGSSGDTENSKHVYSRLYEFMGPDDKYVMVQKIETIHVVDIQYMNIGKTTTTTTTNHYY